MYYKDDKDGFYNTDLSETPANWTVISEAEYQLHAAILPPPTNAELLAGTDQYMSRVTEDTVVNLLLKGTVTKADYPQIVWDRINYRRSLRNQQPI